MKIPQTIHHVWLGTRPMHPLMTRWREEWASLHPDWKVKLWRDSPGLSPAQLSCGDEVASCRYPEYLASCPTNTKRSEVWRYDILEQQGGVYVDADFEPVRRIDPLIDDGVGAFAGLCDTLLNWKSDLTGGYTKLEVSCALMGCVPHHSWMRDIVKKIPSRDPLDRMSLFGEWLTNLTHEHPSVRLFDPVVFYPFPWHYYALQGNKSLQREPTPAETYAVHRWSSLWFPEKTPGKRE